MVNTSVRFAARVAACCASLALPAAPATAQDIDSANYMLPGCKDSIEGNPRDYTSAGVCLGTVKAIAYMARVFPTSRSCVNVPTGVTNVQAMRVVVRYIEARPNRMHEPLAALALEALMNTWPCRK
jgi:hypothetical protein